MSYQYANCCKSGDLADLTLRFRENQPAAFLQKGIHPPIPLRSHPSRVFLVKGKRAAEEEGKFGSRWLCVSSLTVMCSSPQCRPALQGGLQVSCLHNGAMTSLASPLIPSHMLRETLALWGTGCQTDTEICLLEAPPPVFSFEAKHLRYLQNQKTVHFGLFWEI